MTLEERAATPTPRCHWRAIPACGRAFQSGFVWGIVWTSGTGIAIASVLYVVTR